MKLKKMMVEEKDHHQKRLEFERAKLEVALVDVTKTDDGDNNNDVMVEDDNVASLLLGWVLSGKRKK